MLIRMNNMDAGFDNDPFSRLENLLQRSRNQAAQSAAALKAPQMPEREAEDLAAMALDFENPSSRAKFMDSLQHLTVQEQDAGAFHELDAERVAALLDFD